MGLQTEIFTPIFAMARTAGWIAHVREQAADNSLIRSMASYVGPDQSEVPALDAR